MLFPIPRDLERGKGLRGLRKRCPWQKRLMFVRTPRFPPNLPFSAQMYFLRSFWIGRLFVVYGILLLLIVHDLVEAQGLTPRRPTSWRELIVLVGFTSSPFDAFGGVASSAGGKIDTTYFGLCLWKSKPGRCPQRLDSHCAAV